MSDLTGKFEALGIQLATQHTELMDALSTIAYALGAPPSAPEFTIEDIVLAIADTNTLLTGIRADMNEQLTDIFNTLDTINNNASLNAQRLYLLMLQNSCPCDTEAPLLPLPIDTTPTEAENTVKCQRVQYFLDMFISWAINCGVYLNMHGSISSFQIKNLLDIVIGDISLPDSELSHMSISTRDNLSTLLNTDDTPSAINASIFDALTDSVVITAMRQALYGADNASDGKDAIDTAIGANVSPHANILVAMFYSSWANVIYSAVPVVDASAYDGEVCEPPVVSECETVQLPSDPGCSTYEYGGSLYGRITVSGLSFAARIQDTTTAVSTAPILASTGGLTAAWDGSLILWSTLRDMVGTYPAYLDSSPANSTFSIEFCDLIPLL